ncbi:BrnT family toxin [Candidatus Microgenomates bacterium]|nr:BrnT family toxin [Candidatus Microgenomates bacterium]
MITHRSPIKFIWDKGNEGKNWLKHKVTNKECEEVFFDFNKQEYPDPQHSKKELRKVVVGKSKNGRILFIVFTMRNNIIRVISARNLNKKKEVDLYEKAA